MRTLGTTRCCAIVLAVIGYAAIFAFAQTSSFFPVRTVWTVALTERLSAPPLFIETVGYIPIGGKQLAAYDLAEGRQAWTVDATVGSKPAASDGLVFIAEERALSALRAADGSRVWRAALDLELAAAPVSVDGWLIASDQTGTVHGFRALDGILVWRRDLRSRAQVAPTIASNVVYVPLADGRIIALRRETGTPVWEKKLGGAPNEVLALDDRLYVGSTDNFFYALDRRDGRILWRWRTGGDVIGLPIVDERRVYFVSLDNTLYALNRRSGNLDWRRPLPTRPSIGAVRAGATLIVSGSDTALYGFRVSDGQPAGRFVGETLVAPPFVSSGPPPAPLLIVVTDDLSKGASVTALGPENEAKAAPEVNPSDRFQ